MLGSTYQDLFKSFNQNKVIYVVIGGYAVNYYGYSRMTEDLDILFKPTVENGRNLLTALAELDYDTGTFSGHDFTQPTHFRLGDPPNTIDLINDTKGLDLKEVFEKAHIATIEDIHVPVISLQDLINNKRALNTYKDLADAEILMKINNGK